MTDLHATENMQGKLLTYFLINTLYNINAIRASGKMKAALTSNMAVEWGNTKSGVLNVGISLNCHKIFFHSPNYTYLEGLRLIPIFMSQCN